MAQVFTNTFSREEAVLGEKIMLAWMALGKERGNLKFGELVWPKFDGKEEEFLWMNVSESFVAKFKEAECHLWGEVYPGYELFLLNSSAYIHTYMPFTPHFMLLSHSNVYCRLLDPHSVSVDIMQHEPLVSALVNGWGMIALQSILYNHKLLLIVTGSLSVVFICYCCYYKKEKCIKVE